MDEELLNSNPFDNRPTNTYGVQNELRKYALREHLNREVQVLTDPDEEELLDGDLMVTNPANRPDLIQEARLDKARYVKEVRTFYNIDSRNRQAFEEKLVPKDPNTQAYTREIVDKCGNVIIERYSADDLNLEIDTGELIDPFFERNDEIFYRDVRHHEANNYEIRFGKTLNNVKTIRMISSEIPNPMSTINSWNNLILIDIRDNAIKLTDCQRSLGLTDSIQMVPIEAEHGKCNPNNCSLPFFLVQIPQGIYDLDGLLQVMEEVVNETIEKRSKEHFKNLFSITGTYGTGIVSIKLNQPKGRQLSFHWRFWFSPGIPEQRLLYWMLGFPRPYERTMDGCNKYVLEWNNLFVFTAPTRNLSNCKTVQNQNMTKYLTTCGLAQVKPFRRINLNPEKYIFLILEEAGSLTDESLPETESIFAKIQLTAPPGITMFNTFVNTPKTFVDVPLRELSTLRVKWIDSDGNLIDWNGLEHSFTLEVIQYVDKLNVNDYSSIRGVTDPTSYSSKEIIFAYAQ